MAAPSTHFCLRTIPDKSLGTNANNIWQIQPPQLPDHIRRVGTLDDDYLRRARVRPFPPLPHGCPGVDTLRDEPLTRRTKVTYVDPAFA